MEPNRESLKVKLFADGADLAAMVEMAAEPHISGLTTNPTLMKKAGISNYMKFAKEVLTEIPHKPISFEIFSDNIEEMKIQGEKIASLGDNVFVKVPISNTQGELTQSVIKYLTSKGIKVNITALMTEQQVVNMVDVLDPEVPSYISVFAGRIADTGRDPMPIIGKCLAILSANQKSELIWASPRELLNIFQADAIGCHIITATNDILKKLELVGKDLEEYSLETVKMFYLDAKQSRYEI